MFPTEKQIPAQGERENANRWYRYNDLHSPNQTTKEMVICYNPLLPQTASERENVEITVGAAQAILTRSVIIIPIPSTLLKFPNY